MREPTGGYISDNYIIRADFYIVLAEVARILRHHIQLVGHTIGDFLQLSLIFSKLA